MNQNDPIILIADDVDDHDFLQEAFTELNYPTVCFFSEGQAALKYLIQTPVQPFFILSDINMPKLNGCELRSKLKIYTDLSHKCIPYLFFPPH